MRTWAVAIISFHENDIKQTSCSLDDKSTWKDALMHALEGGLMGSKDINLIGFFENLPINQEEARQEVFNGDMDFCVTLVSI